jgi:hypothetical protein
MIGRALRVGLVLATLVSAIGLGAAGGPRIFIREEKKRIEVRVDDKLFTALHADTEAQKLYLHPLLSPSGQPVTRAFPMEQVAGESTDHPHQRGVWIGSERVSGVDFWENEPSYGTNNQGTVTLGEVTGLRSGNDEGAFTLHAVWKGPDGAMFIDETRTMTFRAAPTVRTIDIDLHLQARKELTFEDNYDAILGLRLGTEFEEAHGGRAVNAEGLTGWQQLRGSRSAWIDSIATMAGKKVGVAVMDHPKNFRFPTPWHVREYALVFASPFGSRKYSASNPDFSLTMRPGQLLDLRYRILVHDGDLDVPAAFKQFGGQ